MGDRANIVVLQPVDEGAIYVYSPWDGLEGMFAKLQKALRRKHRWGDPSYLCRIIIAEVIRNDLDDETGYGISTYLCDNEHPLLVVNAEANTVSLSAEDAPREPYKTWTFAEFCKLEWSEEFDR